FSGGNEAGDGRAGYGARRLDEHLDVEAIGKTPLNLTHRVTGESEHGFNLRYRNSAHRFVLNQRSYCALRGAAWHVTHITSAGEFGGKPGRTRSEERERGEARVCMQSA